MNHTAAPPVDTAGRIVVGWPGRIALLVANVAGMIDLAALPVWVGTALIGQYGFAPAQAGMMVTGYLLAVVAASLVLAPRLHRLNTRRWACAGFATALVTFLLMTQVHGGPAMALLHVLGGLGAGVGLSCTHGTIGQTDRPHALFAFVSFGLGLSAIVFLGVAQSLVPSHGGALLFLMFAALMALAALLCAAAFPRRQKDTAREATASTTPHAPAPISATVWWCIGGTTLMATCQATMFSFVERIGAARGFGEQVVVVLVASGFVNLLAPVLATLLERRIAPLRVGMAGAAMQALFAMLIALSARLEIYAAGVICFVFCVIFAHTFLFGWMAKQDPSGRAVALTPAMVMSGSALGPTLGGLLVAQAGIGAIGPAILVLDCLAVMCFVCCGVRTRRQAVALAPASP